MLRPGKVFEVRSAPIMKKKGILLTSYTRSGDTVEALAAAKKCMAAAPEALALIGVGRPGAGR